MSPARPWAFGLDEIRLRDGIEDLGPEALAEILENVPVAVVVTYGYPPRFAFANKLFRSSFGAPDADFTGRTTFEVMGEVYTPVLQDLRHRAFTTGEPQELREVPLTLAPEQVSYWDVKILPIRNTSHQIKGVLALAANVTERAKARDAADRQAHEVDLFHERLTLAVEAAEMGMWDWTAASGTIYWSDRYRQIFGISPDTPLTHELWLSFIHPDDREWVRKKVDALNDPASGGRLQMDYRIIHPDGDIRWISCRGRMLYTSESGTPKPLRLLGTMLDVTERRKNEEARQLLAKELDHRVKNLFAMANAMVTMTARTATSTKDMADALHGRLNALAKAHELIRPAVAEDSPVEGETTVAEIVRTILAPHRDFGLPARVLIECAPISVGAKAATSLTLVLHELTTNASKYGSLSVAHGHLTITCWQDGEMMSLVWQETDGPPIQSEPAAKGFGSQLARKSVTDQLGGTLQCDWRAEGLRVDLQIPLSQLSR
ncbi:sensor histidine kinase [Microvirga guangxiensis]|uniref:Blue-light-activated histidine kinase n=1 Tax=Microvirga guangxiensis TaxID=549386 RepID=A0A1G5ES85_9HYPH|nr:PAS domain-containing protein [Microvirga guangxiensis]SCY29833.1 PAS domain S-box-containing protein [Microvirga guangxiensis]